MRNAAPPTADGARGMTYGAVGAIIVAVVLLAALMIYRRARWGISAETPDTLPQGYKILKSCINREIFLSYMPM